MKTDHMCDRCYPATLSGPLPTVKALVVQVAEIDPHPNADRLEVIRVRWGNPNPMGLMDTYLYQSLVTGFHYREGQLGVWVPPGSVLPGWMAVESWLQGKGKIEKPYPVTAKNMRGIMSPGTFHGQWYREDARDTRSTERYALMLEGKEDGWRKWPHWNDAWQIGQDVAADLGIV